MMWIQTYTGLKFYPLNPRSKDVRIEDIAHALSLKCRFGGHCRIFYSIAQHSMLVANHVPIEYELVALLHDASEAYLPDVARPIKSEMGTTGISGSIFTSLELKVWQAICQNLDIKSGATEMSYEILLPDCVKEADDRALMTEARDLMEWPPEKWDCIAEPYPERIEPITDCYKIEQLFLDRVQELIEQRQLSG
jgi:uncharacterized protein